MLCPACRKPVLTGQRNCIYCGQDLSLLQSLHWIKEDVKQAQSHSQVLNSSLDEIGRRITNLEQQISDIVVIPSPVEEEAPVAPVDESLPFGVELPVVPPTPKPGIHPTERPAALPSVLQSIKKEKTPQPKSSHDSQVELQLGQKWMLIAGVTIMVLGIAYFLKYSFDRNWIPPVGRVAMAYLAGVGCLAGGEWFRRKQLDLFGLGIIGGGIATLYAATFAGFQVYQLIPQPLAFVLMTAVTALACTLAVLHNTKWLAVLGLIGGFITPLLINTGQANQVGLMSYMTLLNVGILSIAFVKRWNLLNNLGFISTWLLFTSWMIWNYHNEHFWTTLFFANLFFLIYTLVPFGYYFISQNRAKAAEFSITLPNTLMGFGYTFALISEHFDSRQPASIATLGYAFLFLGMAQYLYRRSPANLAPLVMLLGKASLFLFLTVPILFTGHWITLFWAGEAVVLLWAASRLNNKWLYSGSLLVLCSALLKFFYHDYEYVFQLNGVSFYYGYGFTLHLTARWITLAGILSTLFSYAWLHQKSAGLLGAAKQSLVSLFYGLFGLVLFICSNIETNAFFHDYAPQARLASLSVLWAVFAAGLMAIGFIKNQQQVRQCSIGLFAFTVLKVFIMDLANVATPYRVLSLIVLGVLLIGASYLYHRFATQILNKNTEGKESSVANAGGRTVG